MKKNFKNLIIAIAAWSLLSFTGSFIKQIDKYDRFGKAKGNNCGQTYPIDYIFYNNLFCEVDDLWSFTTVENAKLR